MNRFLEPLPQDLKTAGLFLPLALRFVASFALLILHFALDMEPHNGSVGEWIYVFCLGTLFIESVFEASRSTLRLGSPFSVPSRPWIYLNLFLLCFLVTLLVSFHGVAKAGLAALYIFPVLASAFYVGINTIIGVGAVSISMYALCVVLFSSKIAPLFGHLEIQSDLLPSEQFWLIAFTTLQIMVATLVVVSIRSRLENLGSNLSKSEAVVDELSTLYRNVVESMTSGLVTTNLKGILTSANPSAEQILQTRILPGLPLQALDAIELAVKKTVPETSHFERALTTSDGAEKIVGGTISPLMDSENQQTGFLILFQDLTKIKAMEARMRLSERLAAVGELSSELAHEMRTPLASITGCVQILQKQNSDWSIVEKVMTILIRESKRIGAVVTDFLELASPRDLKIEPLWLPDLLEEVKATCDTDHRYSDLALDIDSPLEVRILGDALGSHQILTNLLSNSRKAVRGRVEPMIKMIQKIQGDRLSLTIADNGIGMDKSRIGDIFTPFRSGFSEGTGIGMSLVFQLTQRMGWEISISSEINAGTEIILKIPLEKHEE
ncbi:MAG: ATP-binding protein [Holophagaceae bacterium]|nr:ATP-binding protein [Holophagaceae bacterium]